MSTFLTLCKRARQEMGIPGSGPSTVTAQTGELKRVVDWVSTAYTDICSAHDNWRFLRSRFTVNTVAGTQAYLPTDCTDTVLSAAITAATFNKWVTERFDTFRQYLTASGSGTQQNLWFRDYGSFRFIWQLQSVTNGQPVEYTIRPNDDAILLGPTPSDIYTITGEYYRVAPALTQDAEAPLFQERHQLAIVWRAVRSYAGYESDSGLYAHADNEYKRLYGNLMKDELPKVTLGKPLA